MKKIDSIEYLETTKNHCLFDFYIKNHKFRGKIFLNDYGKVIKPKRKLGAYGYFYPLNNFLGYVKCLINMKKVSLMVTGEVISHLRRERRTNY